MIDEGIKILDNILDKSSEEYLVSMKLYCRVLKDLRKYEKALEILEPLNL
jgi:hypothetical protein